MYSGHKFLIRVEFANIFYSSVLVFLLIVSFNVPDSLILMKSIYFFFSLLCFLMSYLENHCPNPMIYFCFSSEFYSLAFIFRSMTHFEQTYVCCEAGDSTSLFVYTYSVVTAFFLKDYSFLLYCLAILVENQFTIKNIRVYF